MERTKLNEGFRLGIVILGVITLIISTAFISKNVLESLETDTHSYILKGLADVVIPVVSEVENKLLEEPYNDGNVKVVIDFYETTSEASKQESSLIEFDRTYMPSTGILYGNELSFDVLAVSEGEVVNIEENDLFASIVTIKHSNNLISKYSSLKEVKVNVGDTVNTGEIIGVSGENKVSTKYNNMLYFELMHDGEYVNPAKFYNIPIDEMSNQN